MGKIEQMRYDTPCINAIVIYPYRYAVMLPV